MYEIMVVQIVLWVGILGLGILFGIEALMEACKDLTALRNQRVVGHKVRLAKGDLRREIIRVIATFILLTQIIVAASRLSGPLSPDCVAIYVGIGWSASVVSLILTLATYLDLQDRRIIFRDAHDKKNKSQ